VDVSQAPSACYAFLVCQPSVPNETANIRVKHSTLDCLCCAGLLSGKLKAKYGDILKRLATGQ
jgi:hypothetical protein